MKGAAWKGMVECFQTVASMVEMRGGMRKSIDDTKLSEAARSALSHVGFSADSDGLEAKASCFDHLHGKPLRNACSAPWENETASPRSFGVLLSASGYARHAVRLREKMDRAIARQDTNALLELCEAAMADLPAFPGNPQNGDLSLYDVGRMAAALSGCLALRAEFPMDSDNELILFSCDFSGIQQFIYLIAQKGALKMLRSRSFFLELMMEIAINNFLEQCGLSRANCIYMGGGRAYLLLPNTGQVLENIQRFDSAVNDWLTEFCGTQLYMACAWQPCQAKALMGACGGDAYRQIFRGLSAAIGRRKLRRYTPEQLFALNSSETEGRECRICGRVDRLNEDALCPSCASLIRLSSALVAQDTIFAVTGQSQPEALALPRIGGERYLVCLPNEAAARRLADEGQKDIQFYAKNRRISDLPNSIPLRVADHCGNTMMDALADNATGVRRISVLRADVDNLGALFSSGFEVEAEEEPARSRYIGLIRTAALSRALATFFKTKLNDLLKTDMGNGAMVVYSGGDDLFLIGAWDAIAAICEKIRKAFTAYTNDTLTFSAGLGIFPPHYPVVAAARDTAALEDFAKQRSGKAAVALFDADPDLRFTWVDFEDGVRKEKYGALEDFFAPENDSDRQRGTAFLYRLLGYLRQSEDKINLARCAYLLARMQPTDHAAIERYRRFSERFYAWALDAEQRRQLIAAIYLYIYAHRGNEEGA